MLPLDPASVDPYAKATRRLRESLLGLVDAAPADTYAPTADSMAVLDESLEPDYAGEWSATPTGWLRWYGTTQVFLVTEGVGAISEVYSSPRSFSLVPLHILRPLAESAGRSAWLLDVNVSVEERIVRTMNFRLEELAGRKRFPGTDQSAIAGQMSAVREAGRSLGRHLVDPKGGYDRVRYIDPPPLSSKGFVELGLGHASEYGKPLATLASAAIHGSTNALAMSMRPGPPNLGKPRMAIASSSDHANMVMMAAGLSLIDALSALFGYFGHEPVGWPNARAAFTDSGRSVIRNAARRDG